MTESKTHDGDDSSGDLSLLRAVFDQLPYPVLVADDSRCCVDANPAARELFEAEQGELGGVSLRELFEDSDLNTFDEVWDAMIETEQSNGFLGVSSRQSETRLASCELRGNIAPGLHMASLRASDEDIRAELQRRERRQSILSELGRLALGDSTAREICQRAVDLIGPNLGFDVCVFYPAVDQQPELDAMAVWRQSESAPQPVTVSNEEAWGVRAATELSGRPVFVSDVDELGPGLVHDVLSRAGVCSAALVGIGTDDERFGLLVAASSERMSIGEAETQFLSTLSHVLGQGISSKLSMRRLEESQSRLQVAMRLGRLSQFEWDVPSGRIEFDRQMARNLGMDADEMPSAVDASFEWVYEPDRDVVLESVEAVLNGEEVEYEVYARIRGAEDEWRWQLSRGRAVEHDEEGRALFILGFQQDVHERIESEMTRAELEDQLRQSRKMEALGRLAGGVAHDFNNLLTAISGYADLVREGSEDPDVRADAREIVMAAERAERLTSRLLALSRRKGVRTAVIDLNAMIRDFGAMLERILSEDIIFETELGTRVWHVEVERSAIEQILLNLVVNARDAMPRGGRLTISTDRVELTPERALRFPDLSPGDYIRLTVEDTGAGMDEKTLEHAIEPFFTTKDVGEGTGLGLATVYGAVRQAGGSMTIASEPGEGTVIELYFPRSHQDLSDIDQNKPERDVRGARGETIVVAEDDGALLSLVDRVLSRRGYRVLGFEVPRMAAAWLEEASEPVDLLLTDVVMPEMRGTELAELALELYPSANVLFMSGYTADAEFTAWSQSTNVELLRKPFTPSDLVGRVQELLARRDK